MRLPDNTLKVAALVLMLALLASLIFAAETIVGIASVIDGDTMKTRDAGI